jgi:hypothetical protein
MNCKFNIHEKYATNIDKDVGVDKRKAESRTHIQTDKCWFCDMFYLVYY